MSVSPAVYSGLCAAFASTFGKLFGYEYENVGEWTGYALKAICFSLMLGLNGLVWTFYVKALQGSETTVEATAISTATNYVFSGILGYVLFGEVTGLLWWFGISLIIIGITVISQSSSSPAPPPQSSSLVDQEADVQKKES